MKQIRIKGKNYKLPIYLPDATRAVTKGLDSMDLIGAGIEGVVVNTYHLIDTPGTKVLKKTEGVKNFMNYHGLVVSDSGGWQVFSLIHRNKNKGKITDNGVTFSIGSGRKELFTPEKSIRVQFDVGSDIIICLDDFTPPDASEEQAQATVGRTIKWARKCKKEYEKQLEKRGLTAETRPLLFAVVQGGYFKNLRVECSQALQEIGFDGYGYGGYVIGDNGALDLELSEFVAKLLPDNKPKFALGLGTPKDIIDLYKMGWNMFDCTLPTRDARHRRLYTFKRNPKNVDLLKAKDLFSFVYIEKQIHENDYEPISNHCDCYTCKNFSKSYLRHLFKIKDMSAYRLASIHNLRIYSTVIEGLRN